MQSIGDQAYSLFTRNAQTRLKLEMQDLSQQVTTGLQSDIPKHLAGNLMSLSSMEHELAKIDAFSMAAKEAGFTAEAMQTVLDVMQSQTGDLAADLLKVDLATAPSGRKAMSSAASHVLEAVMSGLNTNLAGRSLFSGTATNGSALAPAEDLVDLVRTDLVGAVTFEDVVDRVNAFFDDPGGTFETTIYTGSTQSLAPSKLSDTESVSFDIRSDKPLFRDVLKAAVLGQLATDTDLDFPQDTQTALLTEAGQQLLNSQTEMTSLRADLGAAQERIETSQARTEAERTATQIAHNALISADPFEAATALTEIQFQLESLYSVTARNSRLSLLAYL